MSPSVEQPPAKGGAGSHLHTYGRLYGVLAFLAASLCLQAADITIDREAKLDYDLANVRAPKWSNGALVTYVSNQTPAPVILQFDGEGRQLQPIIVAVPGAETVDLSDVDRGAAGNVVASGLAYDHAGRASGFLAVFSPTGEKLNVVRLYPYEPSRVAVDSDGTIWTAGVEFLDRDAASDSTPPTSGVVRHFEPGGKLIGSFINRSRLASVFEAIYGHLQCARGRVGWYSGPMNGPGSRYYEIAGGAVREYPTLALGKLERVEGIGLTDDGRTYVMTDDQNNRRVFSTRGPGENWSVDLMPEQLRKTYYIYGADGSRLVLYSRDRFNLSFVRVQRGNPTR
jgi:hypothetical protein